MTLQEITQTHSIMLLNISKSQYIYCNTLLTLAFFWKLLPMSGCFCTNEAKHRLPNFQCQLKFRAFSPFDMTIKSRKLPRPPLPETSFHLVIDAFNSARLDRPTF